MKIKEKIPYFTAMSLLAAPLAYSQSPIPAELRTKTTFTPPKNSLRRLAAIAAPAPRLLPRGTYVGELQEKWQFPSDHLPIGMSWDGLPIASWNVMNSEFFSWIEKNSQGLSRSLIAKEHEYIGDSKLTVRDVHNIELILEMVNDPSYPRSLISLQECSAPFLEELKRRLPPYMEIALESHWGRKDQNAILFDNRYLEIKKKQRITGVFTEEPARPFQDILFQRKDNHKFVRVLNAHIPGNPDGPARYEFADYLARTESKTTATIAMGDMNFNELEMKDALQAANKQNANSYQLLTSYCTNINPYSFDSKAIDHFIINSAIGNFNVHEPEQVMKGLEKIVKLLELK